MFYKLLLCILITLLNANCSNKEVKSDLDPSDGTAKCKSNPYLKECDGVNDISCRKISGVEGIDVCKDNFPPNISQKNWGDGDVAEFFWQNTLPWYYKADAHKYGFDKDPMSNWPNHIETGKDVYVSVAAGEKAFVELKIPPEYEKNISLVNENGIEICSGNSACQREHSLDAGVYRLMKKEKGKLVDLERNLHVISYKKKEPYRVTYVQFDATNGDPCENDGCYTRTSIQKALNEVFSQAVLSVELKEVKPSDLGLDEILEFDATEGNYEKVHNKLKDLLKDKDNKIIYEEFQRARNKYEDSYNTYIKYSTLCSKGCTLEEADLLEESDKQYTADKEEYDKQVADKGVRLVLGMNSFRLIWRLDQQNSAKLNLNHYRDFISYWANYTPDNSGLVEGRLIPMTLKSYPTCKAGSKEKEVLAKFMGGNHSNNTFMVSLQDKSGKSISFSKDCDYLYVDASSFVPGLQGVEGGAAEAIVRFTHSKTNKYYAAYMLAPRQIGKSSQYTIVHEIGHSFGLSDLYVDENDHSVPFCLTMYDN